MKENYISLTNDLNKIKSLINTKYLSTENAAILEKCSDNLAALISKEEPKKIKVELYEKVCPLCNKNLGEYYTGDRCSYCGQLLKYDY